MTEAPYAGIDPFAAAVRGIHEPNPAHAAMRALGQIVRADAPAGGPVWIVTAEALARDVLADVRIAKDPALAPAAWDHRAAGLEPTAADQLSLTTLDGPEHAQLRRAHVPLFVARRMHDRSARIAEIARDLLADMSAAGGTVDLMADFTTRFPLLVLLDLLGVPLDRIDQAASACRGMHSDDPRDVGAAMAGFMDLAAAALLHGQEGLAAELRERVRVTDAELHYLLFALIFAGQLTTDAALGFLLAYALDPPMQGTTDQFVAETLRRHPPAPFGLWRFTSTDLAIGGVELPPRSPVLVDIAGINTAPGRAGGPDLTFGAGPHYCIGAVLARVELGAVVQVLADDFPAAGLAVPLGELRQVHSGGIQGGRLAALPVVLRG